MKTDIYKYVHSPPSADSRRVLVSQFQVKVCAKSTVLNPYSTQGPNPTNRHELTNIWIRGLKRTQFAKILIITESYNPKSVLAFRRPIGNWDQKI